MREDFYWDPYYAPRRQRVEYYTHRSTQEEIIAGVAFILAYLFLNIASHWVVWIPAGVFIAHGVLALAASWRYAKAAIDACNKIVFKDDSQITDLIITKRYAETARLVIVVDRITLPEPP